jgi:hypothetical protein
LFILKGGKGKKRGVLPFYAEKEGVFEVISEVFKILKKI